MDVLPDPIHPKDIMHLFRALLLVSCGLTLAGLPAQAAGPDALARSLAPHKALYDITLVATHSGSQVLNIKGKMAYEWKPVCDAWITGHKFQIFYEYADSPGMRITSDFSTYEMFDGKGYDFASRRYRDGTLYQEIRGAADSKKALYSQPEGVSHDLKKGTLFPMGHTMELIRRAKAGDKFYAAQVFDGSDEDGPIEINTFIGKKNKNDRQGGKKIDESLLKGDAWKMRMAVFKAEQQEEESDYEMDIVFHDNGIISDMIIEYDDFSVRQSLVALEKVTAEACGSSPKEVKNP